MLKMVCFDMDGTIADLMNYPNWLGLLREYSAEPYAKAKPMWDMEKLREVLVALQNEGIEVRIITWMSMESNREYDRMTRAAKLEWLKKYNFPFDNFHCVRYGATKADSVRKYLNEDETAILFDDNKKVREGWSLGCALDPTCMDIVEFLRNILD